MMAEGFRLGPYEIVAPIGAVGMGKVHPGAGPAVGLPAADSLRSAAGAAEPPAVRPLPRQRATWRKEEVWRTFLR